MYQERGVFNAASTYWNMFFKSGFMADYKGHLAAICKFPLISAVFEEKQIKNLIV